MPNSLSTNLKSTGLALLALLMLVPVFSILVLALRSSGDIWSHLFATVLPHYLAQTALLLVGLGVLTLLIGAPLAWLLTGYTFPGSHALQWLALLPMAMPTYIIAYLYVELLNYAGPVQAGLRQAMGWNSPSDYAFPEIRSVGGAIFVLSFVLYPYVFLAARAAFMKQSQNQIDVSRTLGRSSWDTFWRVVVPQARPALVIGLSLVLLEALNDIGAMNFFGVQTLTAAVFSTWLGQGNLEGAAQLALLLVACVALILWAEKQARGREHALRQTSKPRPLEPVRLTGFGAVCAFVLAVAPVALGFGLPFFSLLRFVLRRQMFFFTAEFWGALQHSLALAVVTASLTLFIGVVLSYALRQTPSRGVRSLISMSTLGYAIPGTILGLGFLVALGHLDNWLSPILSGITGQKFGLIFSGTSAALVLAYATRFLAMAQGSADAGLQKISTRVDDVARTLGSSPRRVFQSVHLPLLRPALLSGAILVFVDCMKELSATLILRPFNFNTLATEVYDLASLDKLEASAAPALAIVAVGLLPIYVLARALRGTD